MVVCEKNHYGVKLQKITTIIFIYINPQDWLIDSKKSLSPLLLFAKMATTVFRFCPFTLVEWGGAFKEA